MPDAPHYSGASMDIMLNVCAHHQASLQGSLLTDFPHVALPVSHIYVTVFECDERRKTVRELTSHFRRGDARAAQREQAESAQHTQRVGTRAQ